MQSLKLFFGFQPVHILKKAITHYFLDKKVERGRFVIPKTLTYTKAEVSNLYPSIFPFYPEKELEEVIRERTVKLETAAVVFNSGLVLKRQWGHQIDAADIVIRVNFMPTNGFEDHVGSKTTIRVLGREWLFQEKDEILIRTYNSKGYTQSDIVNYQQSLRFRESMMYISKHDEITSIFSPYLGGMMTNGFRSVVLALSLCKDVTIYGADPQTEYYKKGQSLSHFPRKSELDYITRKMDDWNVKQDLNWYFESMNAEGRVFTKIHPTMRREYAFYRLHPRVRFAN